MSESQRPTCSPSRQPRPPPVPRHKKGLAIGQALLSSPEFGSVDPGVRTGVAAGRRGPHVPLDLVLVRRLGLLVHRDARVTLDLGLLVRIHPLLLRHCSSFGILAPLTGAVLQPDVAQSWNL